MGITTAGVGYELIQFYAGWCNLTELLNPLSEEFEKKYGEEISVVRINVDEDQSLLEEFGVKTLPFLVLLKNGEPIWTYSGLLSPEGILATIR